jgi:hypothetical protein
MDFTNFFELMMSSTFLIVCVSIVCTTLPFILIAAFLIRSSRRSQQQAVNSQSWPFVMGEVVSAHVEARRSTDADGHSSTSYHPRITYEYEVRGHRYQSNQVSFGGSVGSGSSSGAQAVADRYIPGNRIRVYYNPDNPGEAVLERSAGSSSKILIWVAVFIIFMVVCISLVSLVAIIVPILGLGGFLENLPNLVP